jgi:hypothetical protein
MEFEVLMSVLNSIDKKLDMLEEIKNGLIDVESEFGILREFLSNRM